MSNKDKVIELFRNNNSSYNIGLVTGLSNKEICHYIRQSEEMTKKHQDGIREQRLADSKGTQITGGH